MCPWRGLRCVLLAVHPVNASLRRGSRGHSPPIRRCELRYCCRWQQPLQPLAVVDEQEVAAHCNIAATNKHKTRAVSWLSFSSSLPFSSPCRVAFLHSSQAFIPLHDRSTHDHEDHLRHPFHVTASFSLAAVISRDAFWSTHFEAALGSGTRNTPEPGFWSSCGKGKSVSE